MTLVTITPTASVKIAKASPRVRNATRPSRAPATDASTTAAGTAAQKDQPDLSIRMPVPYAPIPKKAACASDSRPV